MSQKRKKQRENHTEEMRRQGDKVVMGIIATLIVLAIIFMIFSYQMMS